MKIHLIEDSLDLALNVSEFLESKGHIIDYSADGISALNLAFNNIYDVIILDVMLPGLDGFSFCRQLRENSEDETPVIMLTAKDTEQDKLKGFEVGADDYLIKPFSLPELEARLFALVRRNNRVFRSKKPLVVSDLVYCPENMNLKRGLEKLYLKPVPRKILIMLMRSAGRVVSRQEIETEIWNDDPPDSEVLRSHIYAIRSEINKNNATNLLHTIRGVGYILGETDV
jgi:DNA-binding response OmpR family regulator